MLIESDVCEVLDKANNIVAVGKRDAMKKLKIDFRLRINECAHVSAVSLQHWHRRLGHVNVDPIKKMYNNGLTTGVDLSDNEAFSFL